MGMGEGVCVNFSMNLKLLFEKVYNTKMCKDWGSCFPRHLLVGGTWQSPSNLSQLNVTWVQRQPRYLENEEETCKWQTDVAEFFA